MMGAGQVIMDDADKIQNEMDDLMDDRTGAYPTKGHGHASMMLVIAVIAAVSFVIGVAVGAVMWMFI